jgi:hypothetical protein
MTPPALENTTLIGAQHKFFEFPVFYIKKIGTSLGCSDFFHQERILLFAQFAAC